ncbi:MAG: peptidase MA family metallohydrolase [Candidatus Omnitrophota bacterium]
MKKLLFTALIFYSFFIQSSRAEENWKETRSQHFIVCFTADKDFAQKILNASEEYYKSIAYDLGYQRYENFWLWEERAKIYTYPDHDTMISATNQPGWTQGVTFYDRRTICTYWGNKNFMETILPHELTHLIFRDFIGFKNNAPLWLDEGVAQWTEKRRSGSVQEYDAYLLRQNRFIPLFVLIKLDNIDLKSKKYEKFINIFYHQSLSLVNFLITQHGTTKFTTFCRRLKEGELFEDALRFSYSPSLKSLSDLETQWKKHIREAI